jgi:sulfinoalanine decarboxylase/sulfinoalanine decarboxylase/aspartate 1-decarboxylase
MKKTLSNFTEIITKLVDEEPEKPIADHIPSNTLFQELDLQLPETPTNEEDFKKALYKLVQHTPKTGTNRFFNQLFGGRNEHAVLGDLLSVFLNNSMYTYKAAGPQIGVEKVILKRIIEMIGWDHNADGTFASGGSLTNFMSMLMARDRSQESIRTKGFSGTKLTVYTSADSHYSIPKNAAFSGIGREQVRYIDSDEKGRLKIDELKQTILRDIDQGYIPTLVNLTAGTTVLGSFDPISEVAEICKEHHIWLHVDGAYCGSVLFSKKYKHLIAGIEKADSFSFNAHKMLSTPLTCSLIMVKDKKYLHDSFSNEASYLYQTDHDEFNLGKTSLQCGRRNDALKFWTLWKRVGTSGLEAIVDTQFFLADCAREYVRSNDDYTLYSFDESVSICFNYKDIPAPVLCTLLYEKAKLQVGYGSFKGTEFIRLVTVNAGNSKVDIINFFKILESFVKENSKELAVFQSS